MWTPDPSVIITAKQKAAPARAALIERFRYAVQEHIDQTARSRNYDSGYALASYALSTNPAWAAEAQAFVAWRDAAWSHAYAELDKVTAGVREAPIVERFIAELPGIDWPQESGL